jgi:hypothetical protein
MQRSGKSGGEPRGRGYPRIDSGQGKLTIAAANHQGGLAATLGRQQRNDFGLHAPDEASRVPAMIYL